MSQLSYNSYLQELVDLGFLRNAFAIGIENIKNNDYATKSEEKAEIELFVASLTEALHKSPKFGKLYTCQRAYSVGDKTWTLVIHKKCSSKSGIAIHYIQSSINKRRLTIAKVSVR